MCHTEAWVQSEHTKNDDKNLIQSIACAFVLPRALVNSGLGDKGLIPRERARQDECLASHAHSPFLWVPWLLSCTFSRAFPCFLFCIPLRFLFYLGPSIAKIFAKSCLCFLMTLFSEVSSVTYMLPKLYCMLQQASFLLGTWCTSHPQSLSATQSVQTCTQTQPCPRTGIPAHGSFETNIY